MRLSQQALNARHPGKHLRAVLEQPSPVARQEAIQHTPGIPDQIPHPGYLSRQIQRAPQLIQAAPLKQAVQRVQPIPQQALQIRKRPNALKQVVQNT